LVDTSSQIVPASVIINLPPISSFNGIFPVQIYIIDVAGSAGAFPIIVNTVAPDEIDGAASTQINTPKGNCVITIASYGYWTTYTTLTLGGLLGDWDANANVPFLQSGIGTVGNYYLVSVAGNTNLDGENVWQVGDWALFTAGNVWVRIANPYPAYNLVQDEGVNLPQRNTIDFQGDLITATDNGVKTVVTVDYSVSAKVYGSFYDTTSQTAAANVQTAARFNSTDLSNGVTIVNDGFGFPTLITVSKTAIYNLQFSAQLAKTGGAKEEIYIWFRKNGINIPDSNTSLTMANNGHYLVAAWNLFLQLNAGENAQIMFMNTNGAISINSLAPPVVVPPIPAIPSIILTVTEL